MLSENLNNLFRLIYSERIGFLLRGRKVEEDSVQPYCSIAIIEFVCLCFHCSARMRTLYVLGGHE